MRKLCLLLTMVAFLLSLASPLAAISVAYTTYTAASGSLDGEDFTNSFLQITWYSDTNNVTGGPPLWQNKAPGGAVMVTVPGIGVDFFKDAVNVYDQQQAPAAAGWVDTALNRTILATFNTAFASYDLKTDIAKSGPSFINAGFSFPTLGGDLVLTDVESSTFIAHTYVPEPSSLLMLGSGLLGVVAYARRRFIG